MALAERHGISEGEAVRRAVALMKCVSEEEARGGTLLIRSAGGAPEPIRILYA